MNIYDVSKKAGVSIATVSRVINNNTNVRATTRDKVIKVINEYDYKPNSFARGLGFNSMNTIGIMCADSSDPFMAKAIFHLEQGLRKNHYDVLLCCTGHDLNDKKKYLDLLLSKRTDAILLVGSNYVELDDSNNDYIRLAAQKVPVMILNGTLNGPNIYSTLCDDYTAVMNATTGLIKNGSKNILYLYNANSYSGNRKVAGFKAGLKKQHTDETKIQQHIHFIDGSVMETIDYLTQLSKLAIPFDAIIASDDSLAIGALKYAKRHHINIPNELSIIGYNNSILATCTEPELTSIDNQLETLCSGCVTTLMDVFKGQPSPIETIYPPEIIKRGTTSF